MGGQCTGDLFQPASAPSCDHRPQRHREHHPRRTLGRRGRHPRPHGLPIPLGLSQLDLQEIRRLLAPARPSGGEHPAAPDLLLQFHQGGPHSERRPTEPDPTPGREALRDDPRRQYAGSRAQSRAAHAPRLQRVPVLSPERLRPLCPIPQHSLRLRPGLLHQQSHPDGLWRKHAEARAAGDGLLGGSHGHRARDLRGAQLRRRVVYDARRRSEQDQR